MKTLKHVFAIVLTIALMFALAAPAFADGTITVMDPGSHDYDAYKIFSVADDGSGNLTYTAADPWKTAILTAQANGDAGVAGLQIDGTTGVVTKLASFKAADFAKWAKDYATANASAVASTKTALDTTTKSATVAPGYYMVVAQDATAGDVASLCTVIDGKAINIQNKNDMPFDKKAEDENGDWVEESGVQVGESVNFKIVSKVPDVGTATSYVYLVHDELTEGLDLDVDATNAADTVTVEIGGTAVALQLITDPNAELIGNQIRIKYDGARAVGFDLSLDMMTQTAGNAIEITYSATVNSNAVNKIEKNRAILEYGDVNDINSKVSETTHYTNSIVIDKYETNSPETKVPGAKFMLQNDQNKYYAVDANGVVSWEDDIADATIVETDAEGGAVFAGLKDGTYTLTETEAPAGYTMLTAPITVTVNGEAATASGLSEAQIALALSEIVHVNNTPGTLLPSTGGIGTTIFYIGGGLLVLAAIAVILIASRKKQQKAN